MTPPRERREARARAGTPLVPHERAELGLEEYRRELLSLVDPPTRRYPLPDGLPVSDAVGRVLAADVTAAGDVPDVACSTVAGYAVRWADVRRPPALLTQVADLPRHSRRNPPVAAGECVRVLPGGALPSGTDAVIPDGLVEADGVSIRVGELPPAGPEAHVRPSGLVVHRGDLVASAGRRIDPGLASALLTAGVASVPVWLPPRVAVIVVADHSVVPGHPRARGEAWESTGGLLSTHIERLGVHPTVEHVAGDDLAAALDRVAANRPNVIVLAGGPTDADVIAPGGPASGLLARASGGGFRAVRVSPGRRQGWLRWGGTAVVCIPGDPFAASVTAELLLRPLLLRLAGSTDERAEYGWLHGIRAMPEAGWASLRGVREVMPVRLRVDSDGVLLCSPVGEPDLPQVADLADADALALVGEDVSAVTPELPVQLWAVTR